MFVHSPEMFPITLRSALVSETSIKKSSDDCVTAPVRVYCTVEFGPEMAVRPDASREVTSTGSLKRRSRTALARSTTMLTSVGPTVSAV